LPVPSGAPAFAALDAWLTTAMDWASAAGGSAWPESFSRGAMHGFVFQARADPADALLCGAIAPSRDSAGRLFPLALAAPLRMAEELLPRPELLPLCLEGVWAEMTPALADLVSDRLPTDAALPLIAAESDGSVDRTASSYDGWVAELPLAELWTLLGPSLVAPAPTLRFLLETLRPLRRLERPSSTLSLRLPLGMAGGAGLCVWLDLVRRYTGWQATLPGFFWSHDGSSGEALLHLGTPCKATLAELWMPNGDRNEIADLTKPADPRWVEAFSPLPSAVAAALADPTATVAQLLSAVELSEVTNPVTRGL
jgi:type VI secretion system ImpM family protein